MKKLFLLLIFTFPLWGLGGCEKDDNKPSNPIDQLPPATQTGAGTFGCLVNGVPYVDNSGFFNCFYQLVDGEYYFGIGSDNEQAGLTQIIIGSNKKPIVTNIINQLNENTDMNFYGEIKVKNVSGDYVTTNKEDGTLIFTKFDVDSQVVSGTFEFSLQIPDTGQIIHITEGRFDSHFTQ
jgi:hypothetical protein